MEQDIEDGDFNVNLQEVINHHRLFAVTRLLAASMMQQPYAHPGFFIRDLSQSDLQLLIDHMDPGEDEFENIVLIAMMLTVGEGVATTNAQMHRSINALIVMLTSESLRRKGLVKVHHHNFSFGDDADNNLVLEKIDGVDYQRYIDGDDL